MKEEFDQKGNKAFGLGNDKGEGISEDDAKENLTESEKDEIKKRDKELDELNALRQKLDGEDAEVKNSAFILESQKSLFPAWTLQRILKEAINLPELYWLEPKTFF